MFRTSCSLVLIAALAASTAVAGPLGSDPTGIPEFTGSVSFNANNTLLVDLDYAVFEPGDYPDDGVNGDDPSDGSQYVYAYQAFNNSASTVLTTVTVGLLEGNEAENAFSDPLHELTGGIEPTIQELNQTTMSFINRWLSPPVPGGDYSSVFLFTSPNPPTLASASVQSGGLVDTMMAPTPMPEPGSLMLLGFGMAMLRRSSRS